MKKHTAVSKQKNSYFLFHYVKCTNVQISR